jgi:16S rRNA C967 or C1407 C5-methylase (RsmB/RsmF family)
MVALRARHGGEAGRRENGLIEVQDGGSQLTCEAVAHPGETVVDLCGGRGQDAGAGRRDAGNGAADRL